MNKVKITTVLGVGLLCVGVSQPAQAQETCLKVTLTGTMGGPPVFNGLAGAGTLVRYGSAAKDCNEVRLQFDTGRGTNLRLSELKVSSPQLTAIFFTHMHSDHVEGLADILQHRWHFASPKPKVDVVCSADAPTKRPPPERVMSCQNLVKHIGDALISSGEIAQRLAENKARLAGGPADVAVVKTFAPGNEPTVVWTSKDGAVKVSAIRSQHIAGHVSYRVDAPAGSVVIGGDAGNDTPKPPRSTSTSANVELLAAGADVIVHSTIHPKMAPDGGSGFPPPVYFRQSTASDIGAMAERAGVANVMLTHLIPPIGAAKQGPFPVPGGALDKGDYVDAVKAGGYKGAVHVGPDLLTLRIPAK